MREIGEEVGPGKKWIRVIEEDMRACGINKNMFRDRVGKREGIRVVDITCVGQSRSKEEKEVSNELSCVYLVINILYLQF